MAKNPNKYEILNSMQQNSIYYNKFTSFFFNCLNEDSKKNVLAHELLKHDNISGADIFGRLSCASCSDIIDGSDTSIELIVPFHKTNSCNQILIMHKSELISSTIKLKENILKDKEYCLKKNRNVLVTNFAKKQLLTCPIAGCSEKIEHFVNYFSQTEKNEKTIRLKEFLPFCPFCPEKNQNFDHLRMCNRATNILKIASDITQKQMFKPDTKRLTRSSDDQNVLTEIVEKLTKYTEFDEEKLITLFEFSESKKLIDVKEIFEFNFPSNHPRGFSHKTFLIQNERTFTRKCSSTIVRKLIFFIETIQQFKGNFQNVNEQISSNIKQIKRLQSTILHKFNCSNIGSCVSGFEKKM